MTSGTCGLHGSTSSRTRSREASLCLASRLRRNLDSLGSTLFTLTWKDRVTPSGRLISALRASGRRISDSESTSWPTPMVNDATGSTHCYGPKTQLDRFAAPGKLQEALTLPPWPTPEAGVFGGDLNMTAVLERRARCAEKHGNNGFGLTLAQTTQLASWNTPRATDGSNGGPNQAGGALSADVSKVAGWPTPMAGTPAQKGYNEAGNTDSSRKTVALIPSSWPTPHGNAGTGAGVEGRDGGANLQTVASWATPTTRDHKDGACQEQIAGGAGSSECSARTTSSADGYTGPVNGFWRDADWLPCIDGKARPVEPGTFPLAHGIAARVGRLRAYGNAIVAPCAEQFIRAYLDLGRPSIDDLL
jgi:hypothetical protein